MLDNVIDLNFYPTEESKNSSTRHRPIGLGIMGYQDLCHMLEINIDSDESVRLANTLQSFISYFAINTSMELAKEKGKYPSFDGSTWSEGKLPIDTATSNKLVLPDNTNWGAYMAEGQLNWERLRTLVQDVGMRNSTVMAIAPTATISYIQGCEQSIEPNFKVLFVYENKSGDLMIINEHFVNDMKKIGIWCPAFAEAVKAVDGDVEQLNIPDKYKAKYKTAHARDMFKLIEVAGARQRWIDQSQSFNIYNAKTSLAYMNDIAFACWEAGLKTTYYWRSKAATRIERSNNVSIGNYGVESVKTVCSIESAKLGIPCESCT
jgi:ribonucleoside-diphosphate reductase alpha chain